MKKIAVIAGTPVDTRMGVDYIEIKNAETDSPLCEPVYLPSAESCDAQYLLQCGSYEFIKARMDEIFDAAIDGGIRDFFIYCNSLSGVFDFDSYMAEKTEHAGEEIRVVTPLQVYRKLGADFNCVGVFAAHNLSTAAIEEALASANPKIYVIGSGNMTVVSAIEAGRPPEEIVRDCGLAEMLHYMEASGAEAIILGCTHFPYLKDALQMHTNLPIIDPADEMFASLMNE
jgi:glutamate racemase